MTSATVCCSCGSRLNLLLDFGFQPPSNRYAAATTFEAETHPLRLAQCVSCGLLQLDNPMPMELLAAPQISLVYNEPEDHLDDLVSRLVKHRIVVDSENAILGLTYKDDSTLGRLNALGFRTTFRLQPQDDLCIAAALTNSVDSILCAIDEEAIKRYTSKHGSADVLIIRHVLEHAYKTRDFLRIAAGFVKIGGYLVIEVPDCAKFINSKNHCFVWEEHRAYFSRLSLENQLKAVGLSVEYLWTFEYALEDSLVAVVKKEEGNAANIQGNTAPQDNLDLYHFTSCFRSYGRRLRELFLMYKTSGITLTLFGAGHVATKFINFYKLSDHIDFVIDDDPMKVGLFIPGTRIIIRNSEILKKTENHICLLALSPESERRVRFKYRPFTDQGGEFHSIFNLIERST